ncbi:MAG TPA: ribonuclease HII [Myxococcota bacterium]|nr:ribonuclease HII [Myxococcota bacterium]
MRERGGRPPRAPSLAELQVRLAAARSRAGLRRLAAALRGDDRAGARALLRACERTLAEQRRLDALFALRERLRRAGVRLVAGVDEVGVGPLAGPVVAAAVVLGDDVDLPGLDDSKRLSAAVRERLAREIRRRAVAWAVGEVQPAEIDRLNVYRAALEAMRRAVLGLAVAPDHLLVDARRIPGVDAPQTALVDGDACDGSIAAASIVAKVHRDALMERLDRRFPGYGFAKHKGYATREHLRALRVLGPSGVHRRSFAPVLQLSLAIAP